MPGALLGAIKGAAPTGGGHALFSGVSLRHRRGRKASAVDQQQPPAQFQAHVQAQMDFPAELSPEPRPRRSPSRSPSALAADSSADGDGDLMDARGATPLDTVSKSAPPHIAVRYGDVVRLFARSRFVSADAAGGYVGTFELEKRFLASKSAARQGELACVPPILDAAAAAYRPSSFTILSNAGLGVGTPVSYGDVLVLVDERGRVWNNKMGLGPNTKHGYFSPREPNTPGEMYVRFYQLPDDEDDDLRSSESSDEDDNFVFFSQIAKTTRNVAETTFGKSTTQLEANLASAALSTMGRVVYYGDRNLVIDVADSNRVRSKFNRVITHYCKNEQHPVQGGFLRCDGRGKAILFELHGADLPTITAIDMSTRAGFRLNAAPKGSAAMATSTGIPLGSSGGGIRSTRQAFKSMMRPAHVATDGVAVGQPVLFNHVQRSMVITVRFSDGGCVLVPCNRLAKNEGIPFSRVVLSSCRPLRVTLSATRASRRHLQAAVDLRGTLRGTYRQIAKLSCVVIVAYVCAAYACTHVFGSIIVLPAVYVGIIAGAIVFIVEAFFPGKIVAVRQIRPSSDALEADDEISEPTEDDNMGDWQMTVLSIEGSESERNVAAVLGVNSQPSSARRSLRVPKSFLVAEGGDLAKATARYELTLAWRREVQADAVLNTPQTYYDVIKSYVALLCFCCGIL